MAHSEGHGSPVKLYWIFCAILCFITFMEWTIFKYRVDWNIANWFLVTALLVLSLTKFIMVVGWYMHLKYDPAMIKQFFVLALIMITATGIGLGFLMA
ncbi:MAG: cytochrome C oxidase subunit IV family protein [Oligoflexales bacterium]